MRQHMIIKRLKPETTEPEQPPKPAKIKLGLIGNGIGRSSAPRLHQIAGAMSGLQLSYDLIDLQEHDPACFEATLARCAAEGYRGVNVTYPFKERVAKIVEIPSPVVQEIGSVNTVIFGDSEHGRGYNSEFLAAAQAQGLALLSGYELFFYQGVDAFEYFTGIKVDEPRLRLALQAPNLLDGGTNFPISLWILKVN